MKFSWAVAIVVIMVSVACWAQQSDTFKLKKSPPEKLPRSLPVGVMTTGPTAASANAKELQKLEHQTAKTSEPAQSSAKKTLASTAKPASAIKLEQDKPNPPINFSGISGAKPTGLLNQAPNPFAGRLKQKTAQQP